MRSAVVFLSAILVFLVTATPVFGLFAPAPGGGQSSSSLDRYRQALKEPGINLEQFSLFNLDFTTWGLSKLLIGVPGEAQPGGLPLIQVPNQHGAFGVVASLMATMYSSPPISGFDYLADLGKNIGFGKPVHAQGGFEFLQPVRNLWQISRNVAYLAFVIIFVVIGFMVMMRARIDPRTVATVQAAIPGIIIALILVTFSFALAGLMVDIGTVSIRIIAQLFIQSALAKPELFAVIDQLETGNKSFFQFITPLFSSQLGAVATIANEVINTILTTFGVTGVFGDLISQIGGGLFALIIALALVFAVFKTFMMLLTAFVTIILLTITAPFQFLVGAIPGRGGVFVGWARSMLQQVLIFPVTFALIVLSAIFVGAQGFGGGAVGAVNPIEAFPRSIAPFGFQALGIVNQLIGVGIFLMLPRVTDMLRDAFAMKAPPEWAGEAGRAIGGAVRRVIPFA